VADAGFEIVRIPVTWSLHTGPAPDYAIDETFLTRVEEVVGLAVDSGLYAIINLHHDGADAYAGVEWLTLNAADGSVTDANNSAVRERFVAVWTQLAARFADHGQQLLFESMNEIHDGYDAPDPQYYSIINDLNQAFVDTVRAGGSNNEQRHLVVPGYNTNIDFTVAGFEAPADPTPDRLILSVHYYDPWTYAGEASTNVWGQASPGTDTWGQEPHVVAQFDKLKTTFIDAGLPVLMGEYGAVQQAGFEDYRRYYMEYVSKAAKDRGILPVYWDNGGTGSGMDNFALLDRSTNAELHPTILEAMMRAATSDYALSDVAPPAP
jgi:aryl-phospho-beta-D-glucosidase BglC (GH1 family)